MAEGDWQFVRRIVSVDEIAERPWCDRVHALGSFWVDDPPRDVGSQVAKFFKEGKGRPQWPAIATAYADLAAEQLAGVELDAVTRVLSADETDADQNHPLEQLARAIGKRLGLPAPIHPIRRRAARLSMRNVPHLSGADRLTERIDFVLTDLQVCPVDGPRRVLLVDDILCLGASMHVYAAALKKACGAERVIGINIAATRFRNGSDGWDDLRLDLDRLLGIARGVNGPPSNSFDAVWLSPINRTYHVDTNCRSFVPKDDYRSLRFLVAGRYIPCPSCVPPDRVPWWQRIAAAFRTNEPPES